MNQKVAPAVSRLSRIPIYIIFNDPELFLVDSNRFFSTFMTNGVARAVFPFKISEIPYSPPNKCDHMAPEDSRTYRMQFHTILNDFELFLVDLGHLLPTDIPNGVDLAVYCSKFS